VIRRGSFPDPAGHAIRRRELFLSRPNAAVRKPIVKKLLFLGLFSLSPVAAFAAGDLPVVGVPDPLTILGGGPPAVGEERPAALDGNSGMWAGGVTGNMSPRIQTNSFSVLGRAGPYPKQSPSIRTCLTGASLGCGRNPLSTE
jgi:hypothetical protein